MKAEWIITAVILGIIGFSLTALIAREPMDQRCVWNRCGLIEGQIVNCDPEEHGSLGELVEVLKGTRAGAVKYSCGEEK